MQYQTLIPLGQVQAMFAFVPIFRQRVTRVRVNTVVVQVINGGTFTFTQTVPSATWVINHPFINQHPSVTLTDVDGNVVNATISYTPNQDQVIVTFAQPFAGVAYLNA